MNSIDISNLKFQENMKVDNIFEDLSDGKVLIRLLESISGEKIGRVGEFLDLQLLEN